MSARRLLTTITAAFLAGAVTTLAVAWGAVPLSRLGGSWRHHFHIFKTDEAVWQVNEWTRPGLCRVEWSPMLAPTGDSPSERAAFEAEAAAMRINGAPLEGERALRRYRARELHWTSGWPEYAVEFAAGWPCRALWCEIALQEQPLGVADPIHPWRGAIQLRPPSSPTSIAVAELTALPVWLVWPGLFVNWAVYTGAWLFGLGAMPSLRRRIRRWRGLCPRCAYDLRHNLAAGCPECGWKRV